MFLLVSKVIGSESERSSRCSRVVTARIRLQTQNLRSTEAALTLGVTAAVDRVSANSGAGVLTGLSVVHSVRLDTLLGPSAIVLPHTVEQRQKRQSHENAMTRLPW